MCESLIAGISPCCTPYSLQVSRRSTMENQQRGQTLPVVSGGVSADNTKHMFGTEEGATPDCRETTRCDHKLKSRMTNNVGGIQCLGWTMVARDDTPDIPTWRPDVGF